MTMTLKNFKKNILISYLIGGLVISIFVVLSMFFSESAHEKSLLDNITSILLFSIMGPIAFIAVVFIHPASKTSLEKIKDPKNRFEKTINRIIDGNFQALTDAERNAPKGKYENFIFGTASIAIFGITLLIASTAWNSKIKEIEKSKISEITEQQKPNEKP